MVVVLTLIGRRLMITICLLEVFIEVSFPGTTSNTVGCDHTPIFLHSTLQAHSPSLPPPPPPRPAPNTIYIYIYILLPGNTLTQCYSYGVSLHAPRQGARDHFLPAGISQIVPLCAARGAPVGEDRQSCSIVVLWLSLSFIATWLYADHTQHAHPHLSMQVHQRLPRRSEYN